MVRKAEVSDISRIAEISVFAKRTAYRSIFNDDAASFGEIQVLPLVLELGLPNALEGFYVFDDGIIRGYIKTRTVADSAELCELYVDPLLQGKGVGKRLLEYFFTLAKTQKANLAWLWVLEKNEGARRFYNRFGFDFGGVRQLEGSGSVYKLMYEKRM